MLWSQPPAADATETGEMRRWIGCETVVTDSLSAVQAQALQDIVGGGPVGVEAGELAPLGIHWCLAPPLVPRSRLQADGHPQPVFSNLPPVPFSRRMWAGGELAPELPVEGAPNPRPALRKKGLVSFLLSKVGN